MNANKTILAVSLVAAIGAAACDNEPAPKLAPTASALKAPKAKTASAKPFKIEKKGALVEFVMEAPSEKIRGRVADAASGKILVDITDLTKTTGKFTIDISGIELYKTDIKDGKPVGEEVKHETQNKHARTWLEIGEDAPADVRKKNSTVEFVIKSVTTDTKDATKLKGDERKVIVTAKGDFLLHGRKTEKTAKLEVTMKFNKDKVQSISIKTVQPFGIGLAEHDVHPREAFGKLAAKTLDMLAPKVAKEARVSIAFTATPAG